MFGCVMGFRDFQGSGCILADDMGLGKTLQAVTLLWTLLTQGTTDQSICRRGLVVCPTSLVHSPTVFQAFFSNTRRLSFPHVCAQVTNWANEFTKCTPACITATNSFFYFAAAQFSHSPLLALPPLHDNTVLVLDVTLPQVAARPHERAGLQRVYQRQSHIHHRLLPALNTSSSRSRYKLRHISPLC